MKSQIYNDRLPGGQLVDADPGSTCATRRPRARTRSSKKRVPGVDSVGASGKERCAPVGAGIHLSAIVFGIVHVTDIANASLEPVKRLLTGLFRGVFFGRAADWVG